jgi:hypothetical protein
MERYNNMTQDQFMIDYYPKGSKVTVDANELQAMIRELKETRADLEKINMKLSSAITMKSYYKAQMDAKILETPGYVTLDIKG